MNIINLEDNFYSIAVLSQIVVSVVQLILPLTGTMTVEQAATMRIVVTLLTFLPAIMSLCYYHKKGLILAFSFYFVILLFNYAFFPTSQLFIESYQAWTLTPISILTVLCMYNIKRYEQFWKLLLYTGRICAFLSLVYFVFFTMSPFRDTNTSYSMHFGYTLLLPIMYLFTYPGIIDKALSLIMFGIVILIGSRGSAGMVLLFYAIYIIIYNRKMIIKLAIVLLFITPIVLTELPKFFDLESARTVTLILRGEAGTHDSGRYDIYKFVERKISERPLTGWGIGADRALLDTFSHNIILEMALHYGVLITILIQIVLITCLIKGLNPKRATKIGGCIYVIMMTLYGLIPLMFSNSYLIDYKFATFVGVILCSSQGSSRVVLKSKKLPYNKSDIYSDSFI